MAAENADKIRIDRDRDEVVVGDTGLSLFIEGAGSLEIDHTSQMDGYVAFTSEDGEESVTIHLMDRSDDAASSDQETDDDGEEQEVPDGWVREELVAGMDTVGYIGDSDEYVGMGGGFKCDPCQHFVPTGAVDTPLCPMCDTGGMIGTVISGTQDVTVLHPEGWFDDDQEGEQ